MSTSFVGWYEIHEGTIFHVKNDVRVANIETGVPDAAALVLEAVRVGRAGPFECSQRHGSHVVLIDGSGPLDMFELTRAALKATA